MQAFRILVGCLLLGLVGSLPAKSGERELCLEEGRRGIEQARDGGYMSAQDAQKSLEMLERSCTMLEELSIEPAMPKRGRSASLERSAAARGPSDATAPGRWFDRPDPMHELALHDVDVFEGRIRILFKAWPSLQQARDPSRSFNLYVAEVPVDGTPELHRLYSGQDERYSAMHPMWLAPGAARVLVQVTPPGRQSPALEIRHARSGQRLDTRPVPMPADPGGVAAGVGLQARPLSDGSLVHAVALGADRKGNPARIGWLRHAPGAGVLARGWEPLPGAQVQIEAVGESASGQPVFLLMRSSDGDRALDDLGDWRESFEVAGRPLSGRLHSASQLFVIAADGAAGRPFGPPLAAQVLWEGDLAIPRDLPYEEISRQSQAQMQLQRQAEWRLGAGRRLLAITPGAMRQVRLHATGAGFALLYDRSGGGRSDPPIDGWHFIEVGENEVVRELRIEPALQANRLQPVDFDVRDDGGFVVLARSRGGTRAGHGQLIGFDADGRETGRIAIADGPEAGQDGTHVELKRLAGRPGHYRAIGTGMSQQGQQTVWVSGPIQL